MSSKRDDKSPDDKNKMDLPVDLASPRVQAAMCIMGATVSNLTPRPLGDLKKEGMTESQQQLAKLRHEKNEIRRKRLIQEIDETANALQEADVDALLMKDMPSPSQLSAPQPKDFDKLLTPSMKNLFDAMVEKQKEDVEETKKRSRSAIQRMLHEKIGFDGPGGKMERIHQREEDKKKVLHDLRKEQKAQLIASVEARKKKHEKNAERLAEQQKAERIRMKELSTKLKETCDVAYEKAKHTRMGDEGKRQENRERMERINESKQRFQQELHEKRVERYEKQLMEENNLQESMLEEKHRKMTERQDQWGAKFTKKMTAVQVKQLEDEQKRESDYKESQDKLQSARGRAEDLQKEKLDQLAKNKQTRWNKLGTNQAAAKEAYKATVKEYKQRAIKGVETANTYREAHRDDAKQKLIDTRDMMTGMVQETKARIQRADEYARKQTIARVQSNAARVQALMEQKEFLHRQRVANQKECMIERCHMKTTIDNIKDTQPKKVNQILKNLDLPLISTGGDAVPGEEGGDAKS